MNRCTCDAETTVHERRTRADGTTVNRVKCRACGRRWTDAPPGYSRGPSETSQTTLLLLLSNPGATSTDLAKIIGCPRRRVAARLRYLVDMGLAVRDGRQHWHAEAPPIPEPTLEPAPEPTPEPEYVGVIVPHRQDPQRSPQRVEWRQYGGRLVKVTIGPTVIDRDIPAILAPPRVRVQAAYGGKA